MADRTPQQPDGTSRPARRYRPSRARRVGDAIIGAFVRAGLVPGSYLLTTRGRRTGRPRTNPVTVVDHDGRRWLIAPYGPVSWVHNARAAGQVSLRRRFEVRHYTVQEVSAQEAGPVLKRYVRIATATRPYFQATRDAPVEAFIAEADRHPVFELTPMAQDPRTTVTADKEAPMPAGPSSLGRQAGRGLLTVANLVTVVAPVAADWNDSHVFNQRWPSHARFHGVVAVTMASTLATLNLWSLWSGSTDRRTSRLFAAAVPIGYWAPFFLALRVPGTGVDDPPHPVPRIAGVPSNLLGAAGTTLAAVAGWLLDRRRS